MHEWQAGMTGLAVAVAFASLLVLLWRPTKRDADVLLAVVSGSMALSLMAPWTADAPTWVRWAVAIGGSATCNGFWLVSRALFRGEGAVRGVHVLVATCVALLIAAHQLAGLAAAPLPSSLALGMDGVLTLSSSILLGLTLLEPLRSLGGRHAPTERRLRLAFAGLFAACVLSTTVLGALAPAWPAAAAIHGLAIAGWAMTMLGVAHALLLHRARHPLASPSAKLALPQAGDGDARLVAELRRQLEDLHAYREPELKVADLAARLGVPEHRVSRLIGQSLGEANFNQWVNRHRVAHARRLLADPACSASILDISGDAGFASLGPFNRAFKAATGMTPSAYRTAARQARQAPEDAAKGTGAPADACAG